MKRNYAKLLFAFVIAVFIGNLVQAQCTNITLTMNDSWGDGWNGGSISFTNQSTGTVYGPYSIGGSTGTQVICFPYGTYSYNQVTGSYPGEITWSLSNGISGTGYSGFQSNAFTVIAPPTCTGTSVTLTMADSYGDGWNGGSITLTNDLGDTYGPYTIASGSSGSESLCLPDACYSISVAGGGYPGEMSWSLSSVGVSGGGSYGSQSSVFTTGSGSCGAISGCMDPTALNYNPAATVDDGSCTYPVAGDNCSLAIDLATLTSPYSGTTVGATNVFTNSCLNGSSGDLLFKIDVADGEVLYIGQRSNGYDSKHRIAYGGACPGVTEVNTGYAGIFPTTSTTGTTNGCLDDNDLTHYYFNNNTGSTQTVYWTQDCYSSSQGTFELEWQLTAPPSNPTGITASASTICEGESTTLTASGASGTTYWFAGSCATSGEVGTGASLSVSPTTTTTYYARNNNGAWSAGCASITINVDAAPVINAGVDQTVCEGASVTLAASGADSYSWDNGITDGVAFTATSTTTYTVTGSLSGNACPGTDAVVVTVNALPVVDAGADETICEGSSVQLAATATSVSGSLATTQAGGNGCGGGNMFDITTGGNQVTVNGFTITPYSTASQNVLVYYRVGSYVGNTTNSAAWTLLGTYAVNGVAGSQVFMPTGDIVIPAGATYGIYVQYNAQYTDGNFTYSNSEITITTGQGHCAAFDGCCSPRTFNGIVHYSSGTITWSPSTTLSSASILDPLASPLSTTTYTLSVSNNGCSASDDVEISVDASPFAANAGEDKPGCLNNSVTLSASNPPVGNGTWTWSPSAPTYTGGTSASDYNAQVVFSAVGQYTGTWTVTNGVCTATPDDAVVSVTSADNNASLFLSAGVATESTFAFAACEEGPWTYYAATATPEEYLFAIKKNGNSFSAVVQITDLPGTTPISSLGGNWQVRGTWLIGRYWNVELFSGSITTPVDIRFFVDPAEVTQAENDATSFLNSVAAATNITPLTFFKTVSTAFDPATDLNLGNFTFAPVYLPYTTGTLNGVTYYELTGLTSFSGGTGGFSVNDSGSPLPVELLSFEVSARDNQYIRLDWATATEINNEGFEVLRSTDGVNFERIAWIDGNGNSTEINEYVFNDRGVDKGSTYYYQLKQIDYDGQYEYFDIKSARLDGQTTFSVGALIPNPSKGNDVISVDVEATSGELLTVEIFDRIGSKVKSASYVLFAAENALDINISDLAEGTYFLNFASSMGTETRKLVVLK